MAFISEWITNIILFILLAIIVDMLLPNSSMQKYVKMVIGLLLIVIILQPLFSIFKSDLNEAFSNIKLKPVQEEKNIENLIDLKKKEIQASTRAYILENMAVQLKSQLQEELMKENYELTVQNVDIKVSDESKETITFEDITEIEVFLSKETAEPDEVPVIKPVEIDTSKQIMAEDTEIMDVSEITILLANELEIDSEKMVVTVEGVKK